MTTGLILNVKRFEIHDGDGIRTTLFLKGCPLRCQWCHNPEGIGAAPVLGYYAHKCIGCGRCAMVCPTGAQVMSVEGHRLEREKCLGCGKCEEVCLGEALTLFGKKVTPEQILPKLMEDADFYANSGGGVTLSGGEPLLQSQFCAELLSLLKKEGINTAVDTCLFAPRKALEEVFPYTDTFLVDVKAADGALHKRLTGQDNAPILENLAFLSGKGARIEIRIPFIPGKNDGEIPGIAKILAALPSPVVGVRVLPFHNLSAGKYEAVAASYPVKDCPTPGPEELLAAEEALKAAGLTVLAK